MNSSCSAVRRRLAEYHDGELTIDEQVRVRQHLSACSACAGKADGLETISTVLRTASFSVHNTDISQLDGLAAGVISRLKAERHESLSATFDRMFEDLHLVWAALSATAATFACLAITVGIFCFSSAERLDSLAAVIEALSSPGSNAYPMDMDANIAVPRQEGNFVPAVPDLAKEEVWAVNATITREGRVADLQLLMAEEPNGVAANGAPNWNAIGRVLDSAAMARFVPARSGGEPVAVNMVWVIAHLTVRPKAPGEVQHHHHSTDLHMRSTVA